MEKLSLVFYEMNFNKYSLFQLSLSLCVFLLNAFFMTPKLNSLYTRVKSSDFELILTQLS